MRRRAAAAAAFVLLALLHHAQSAPLVWLGNVTHTSFTLHADIPSSATSIQVTTATRSFSVPAATSASAVQPISIYAPLHRHHFSALAAATLHNLSLVHADSTATPLAAVTTFPAPGAAAPLVLYFGSCQLHARLDRTIGVLATRVSAESAPTLFVHTGDMAYSDITRPEQALYHSALRNVLTRPRFRQLLSRVPAVYMYDDHDYGANNADASSPSRGAALSNYRALVPSYPLQDPQASYHAFTVGRIRIIVTDLRARAFPNSGTTLGTRQSAWLLDELSRAGRHAVVVWVSTKPWIGGVEKGSDSWGGYAAERAMVATEIARANVTNLVMVAGDAHMLAADDGSHSDYSADDAPPGGFPVFQAAPFGHMGSGKGGPYSHGCFAYRLFRNFHYGRLEISRVGETDGPCVRYTGHRIGRDKPVVEFERCGILSAVDGVGGQDKRCSIPLFPSWVWAPVLLGWSAFIGLITWGCQCYGKRRRKRVGLLYDVTGDVASAGGDTEENEDSFKGETAVSLPPSPESEESPHST